MLTLRPGALTLSELRALWAAPAPLALDPAARPGVDAAARCVDRVIASGETVYGVNTGFGLLLDNHIRQPAVISNHILIKLFANIPVYSYFIVFLFFIPW